MLENSINNLLPEKLLLLLINFMNAEFPINKIVKKQNIRI